MFFSLKAVIILSLRHCSPPDVGHLNTTPDMNRDPFHFLYALQGDPRTLTHPFTHTPEMPPPHQECLLPAGLCVCVCEGTLSSRRARRTHFLCQIASHIPHSPWIRLARAIFSSFLLLLSFFFSLWGALSAIGGTKH